MSNKSHSVLCVMDSMGLTAEIEAKTPRHIPVEYMMECVLLLIENASSVDDIRNKQHLAMEYVDDVMDNHEYEEAMARGMSDDEYLTWLELIMGEVTQCALEIAMTMFQQLKPVLTTCGQIYPNGFVLDVRHLGQDGLYTDLTVAQPVPPSSTSGLCLTPKA